MAEKDYAKNIINDFDADGERFYETGVKNVVLYLKKNETSDTPAKPYSDGVPWNGVTSISENPSGAEATKLYADDIVYLNLTSNEEFGLTLEAYSSPEEFDTCDGTSSFADGVSVGQQSRDVFGLCYKTTIGNDTEGNSKGYKLHLVYGCKAAPSSRAYATINDSPEAITMSWEITTTPVKITNGDDDNFKPTASIVIDSTKVNSTKLTSLETILYGTDPTGTPATGGVAPRLPLPDEVKTLFTTNG